jgi:AraC-like DNA-binding protein
MINVDEPQNPLLKQFVDSIYIVKHDNKEMKFVAYPSIYTPVAIFRNASVEYADRQVMVAQADEVPFRTIACNQFFNAIQVIYKQVVDEIAINFKPLGFLSFTNSRNTFDNIISFHEWDAFLPDLLSKVFAEKSRVLQIQMVENFLLERYHQLQHETILCNALNLFNASQEYKIAEIAALLGIPYKQLYRNFRDTVGCSPVHYRKLLKFRNSIISKLNNECLTRLVDVCYWHNYSDQSYFIKLYKELTGETPGRFLKSISALGRNKLIFKMQ